VRRPRLAAPARAATELGHTAPPTTLCLDGPFAWLTSGTETPEGTAVGVTLNRRRR
jgi:hypothetical protein